MVLKLWPVLYDFQRTFPFFRDVRYVLEVTQFVVDCIWKMIGVSVCVINYLVIKNETQRKHFSALAWNLMAKVFDFEIWHVFIISFLIWYLIKWNEFLSACHATLSSDGSVAWHAKIRLRRRLGWNLIVRKCSGNGFCLTVGGDWRFNILSGNHLQCPVTVENSYECIDALACIVIGSWTR